MSVTWLAIKSDERAEITYLWPSSQFGSLIDVSASEGEEIVSVTPPKIGGLTRAGVPWPLTVESMTCQLGWPASVPDDVNDTHCVGSASAKSLMTSWIMKKAVA